MAAFPEFAVFDELGPSKVVHLYDPGSGMKGVVVVDNVAAGPAIGGVRMAADVSTDEVARLARAMTLKNAAAGLPHGGGKAGIQADPKTADASRLVLAFARAIRDLAEYIPGPDMGTNERSMAIVRSETGRAVGLPRVLGGIPLDEIGATGFGLARSAEVAAEFAGIHLKGARLAVEGLGNVGRHAARFLAELGVILVAASDRGGAVSCSEGLDLDRLAETKRKAGTVAAFEGGRRLSQAELFLVDCDILIPAARPDCIRADNAGAIKARLVLQGANIPATPEAEAILHERGIVNVPDFIANAGGVICASVEYHGGTEADALRRIANQISRNTREVLQRARDERIEPRRAAVALATDRVREAMSYRMPC
ncbi:Glu/Leu/Phe/Val family dehydrogenase [Tautonia marina]|uniref:Glu/Leu/Phe/Val family dehydrogenase n=1 Tax=Tautonia marina TaxID=2653855 RepID=UPI00191C5932|nr:Glu/Leu/Phe/Val dehydrogenase [Tautonia marina]